MTIFEDMEEIKKSADEIIIQDAVKAYEYHCRHLTRKVIIYVLPNGKVKVKSSSHKGISYRDYDSLDAFINKAIEIFGTKPEITEVKL